MGMKIDTSERQEKGEHSMKALSTQGSSRNQLSRKAASSVLALVLVLSIALVSGYGCTPTDSGTEVQVTQTDQTDQTDGVNSGGFVLEDTAVVEVDIEGEGQ